MSDGRVLKGVVGYSPGFEVAAAMLAGDELEPRQPKEDKR
jgi:hypothetical protein